MTQLFRKSQNSSNQPEIDKELTMLFINTLTKRLCHLDIADIKKILEIKDIIENSNNIETHMLLQQIKTMIDDRLISDIFQIERWPSGIICVKCASEKVIKIDTILSKIKFYCEDCEQFFVDDAESPMQNDDLGAWMSLWLISSREDATKVIAKVYNKDITRVQNVLAFFNKSMFKTEKPLTNAFHIEPHKDLTSKQLLTMFSTKKFNDKLLEQQKLNKHKTRTSKVSDK